jgi:broad specificity phosphatase PhoE
MNLHCPARMLLVRDDAAGVLTDEPMRVARVYCAPEAAAQRTAAGLAVRTGAGVEVVAELADLPRDDSAESPAPRQDVVRRFDAAVGAIADLHRGETVVVVAGAGLLAAVLGREPTAAETVQIDHDGTGWAVARGPA